MTESTNPTTDTGTDTEENYSAVPTEYDRQQDSEISEKDAEIARLTERLAAVQAQVAPPSAVVSNQVPGLSTPADNDEAKFHEVPAAGSDSPTTETLGSVPVGETPTVEVTPVPELSESVDVEGLVKTQEDLKTAVAEILVLVQEIHETVVWVRTNVPAMAQGLQDSPLGKMLPSFFATGRQF